MDKQSIMVCVDSLAKALSVITRATTIEDLVLLDEALRVAETDLAIIRQLAWVRPSEDPSEHPFP